MSAPEIVLGDATQYAQDHADAYPLFVRMMQFLAAGDQEPEHVHRDGHFTAVLMGRFLFYVDGKPTEIEGPQLVWIAAGKKHQITALPMSTTGEAELKAAFDQGFSAVKQYFERHFTVACLHDKRVFTNPNL